MALKIHADRSATLTCDDGNIVYSKPFELTDFPLAGVGTLACIAPRDLIQLAPPRSWFCVADSHTRGRSIAAIRR